jgi:hypothetical protein
MFWQASGAPWQVEASRIGQSVLHRERQCDSAGVLVEASAPGADSDAAGLLQIRLAADGPAGARAVAALAAGAVKGALPGGAASIILSPDAPHPLAIRHT